MDLRALADELTDDPLGRGYGGMGNAAAATDLNIVYRTRQLASLDGAVVYDQVDDTEFQALATDALRAEVWNITHLGANIPVGSTSKARARFIAIFGGGSTTITNLLATITQNISRATELGLGNVRTGDAEKARAL